MTMYCFNCCGPATRTYRDGFKRDVVCDRGVGKVRLSPVLYKPDEFVVDHGYIKLQKQGDSYFCSLRCLDQWMPMETLVHGMSHYDSEGLLTQLAYEKTRDSKSTILRDPENLRVLLKIRTRELFEEREAHAKEVEKLKRMIR